MPSKAKKLLFGLPRDEVNATLSYYSRLVVYVAILLFLIEAVDNVPQTIIAALKAIILFVLFLVIQVSLKIWYPIGYENFRWFCLPGIIFLKSWTSLFFFVYLVQLPYDLSSIPPIQIVSWLGQTIVGNFITLAAVCGLITFSLWLITPKDDKAAQDAAAAADEEEAQQGSTRPTMMRPTEAASASAAAQRRSSALNSGAMLRPSYVESRYLDHLMSAAGSQYATDEFASSNVSRLTILDPSASASASHHDDRHSQSLGERLSMMNARSSQLQQQQEAAQAPTFLDEFSISSNKLRLTLAGAPNSSRTSSIGMANLNPMMTRKSQAQMKLSFATMNPIKESDDEAQSVEGANFSTLHPVNANAADAGKVDAESKTSAQEAAEPEDEDEEEEGIAVPFIPNMDQIFYAWYVILICTAIISFLNVNKTNSAVIAFQIAANVLIFIAASAYRMKLIGHLHWTLQSVLQSPVIFTPVAIIVVLLSGQGGFSKWQESSQSFLISGSLLNISSFGAGNFISILLNPAIVSLSFSTVEPIMKYAGLMAYLTPWIAATCTMVYMIAAVISYICQSPSSIALPLLARCITTPIALAVSAITGGNPSLTAATVVINGVIALRVDAHVLDYFHIDNPPIRGLSMGITGTLLGVVALDERKEELAASVGMAGYAIATVIFAMLMAITPFEQFLVGFA